MVNRWTAKSIKMNYYNEQMERLKALQECRARIKALESVQQKINRLVHGKKVQYTMEEYDALLDLRNEVSRITE